MGHVKDQLIEQEESWLEICRNRGWVCEVCGDFPSDRGRAPAYESGLCPRCTDSIAD